MKVEDGSRSGSSTLFDNKAAHRTTSTKRVMRPLMRPDEVGSMDERRCIVKLRNQQPILALRNVYYADKELSKRAWLPIAQQGARPGPRATAQLVDRPTADIDETMQADRQFELQKPGLRFAARAAVSAQPQKIATRPASELVSTDRPQQSAMSPRIPDFSSLVARARLSGKAQRRMSEIADLFRDDQAQPAVAEQVAEVGAAYADAMSE